MSRNGPFDFHVMLWHAYTSSLTSKEPISPAVPTMTSVWMMVSDLRDRDDEEFEEEVTSISGFISRNGIRRAAPGESWTFCEGVIVRPGSR